MDIPCTEHMDKPCSEHIDIPCTEHIDLCCIEHIIDSCCTGHIDMPNMTSSYLPDIHRSDIYCYELILCFSGSHSLTYWLSSLNEVSIISNMLYFTFLKGCYLIPLHTLEIWSNKSVLYRTRNCCTRQRYSSNVMKRV